MNIYAIFNSVLICATGLLVICLTASNWDHPGKTIRIKMSEIGYGLLFIVNGLFALVLFRYENISFETSMELHKWIFFVFAASIRSFRLLYGESAFTIIADRRDASVTGWRCART